MSELLQLIVYTISQSLEWMSVQIQAFDFFPSLVEWSIILFFSLLLSWVMFKGKIQIFEFCLFTGCFLGSAIIGILTKDISLYMSLGLLTAAWTIFMFNKTLIWFSLSMTAVIVVLCAYPSIYMILAILVFPRLLSWSLLLIQWNIMFFQNRQKPAFSN